MGNLDFTGLFTMTTEDALTLTESKKKTNLNENLYKPNIKDEKCTDGNYRALIRFMPFIYEDKVQTTIERWECYLKDVNGENGIFVVSPKTAGLKCPIRELSWKLYSSDSAIDKANSKKINVYQQWYALVEVVKDVQHPEYDGKFMIYQFGKKIHDKIEDALKGSEFTNAINPFQAISAPLFEINLTKSAQKMDGGREVAEYSACKFITERKAPLHFGDGKTLEQTRESMDEYVEWLKTDAPKINDYQWKEWNQETTDKVNALLATYSSSYSAPRTSVASATETVNQIIENQSSMVQSETPTVKMTNEKEEVKTINPDADEAWLNEVLGK